MGGALGLQGFQFAAHSTPAREVGGDFYDFIEMGGDRVGLVVGDVTGKSVSGALVMAASRSVFRMLSENDYRVSDVMTLANKRAKKDIKSGMFVALIYAVLDGPKRSISLSSAGQTSPIHYSLKSGRAALIEMKGDTFPLGILEDAEYQETALKLAPGDKLVFYTDGIVEAMNEKQEMFGFDRLIELIERAGTMPSDQLLGYILGEVTAFAGKAQQHDDITVIVVQSER